MTGAYLLALLLSGTCVLLVDRRYRLFLWRDPRRAAAVLALGVAFFLAWDLAGIGLGVFRQGDSPLLVGVALAPHLPLEELFFLAFLCELTMVLVAGAGRLRRREGDER